MTTGGMGVCGCGQPVRVGQRCTGCGTLYDLRSGLEVDLRTNPRLAARHLEGREPEPRIVTSTSIKIPQKRRAEKSLDGSTDATKEIRVLCLQALLYLGIRVLLALADPARSPINEFMPALLAVLALFLAGRLLHILFPWGCLAILIVPAGIFFLLGPDEAQALLFMGGFAFLLAWANRYIFFLLPALFQQRVLLMVTLLVFGGALVTRTLVTNPKALNIDQELQFHQVDRALNAFKNRIHERYGSSWP